MNTIMHYVGLLCTCMVVGALLNLIPIPNTAVKTALAIGVCFYIGFNWSRWFPRYTTTVVKKGK